jgi:hypothetical protein
MVRPIIAVFIVFLTLNSAPIWAQQDQQIISFKNFNSFKQVVPGIDFYASNRQIIDPYEKPAAEAISRLRALLGDNLPQGAIFICSTLEQKDSYYEPKVLRSGYKWAVMVTTSQVKMQEQIARMKSQLGNQISPEMLERMKTRMPDMAAQAERQMAVSAIQQLANAILQTSFNKDLQYRSSRLDDMGKSPLPDWLDIGITSYATGVITNLAYLQQHLDETFPLDDVLSMSRPFVGSSTTSEQGGNGGRNGGMGGGMPSGGFGGMTGGMGGGMPSGGFGGAGGMGGGMPSGGFGGAGGMGGGTPSGGFGGAGGMPPAGASGGTSASGRSGGQRGGMQRNLPKDEQDRMLFDGQASAFFAYLIEKIGNDKIKTLIKQVHEGKSSRDYLIQDNIFGSGFEKIEEDLANWVKANQPPPGSRNPGMF